MYLAYSFIPSAYARFSRAHIKTVVKYIPPLQLIGLFILGVTNAPNLLVIQKFVCEEKNNVKINPPLNFCCFFEHFNVIANYLEY